MADISYIPDGNNQANNILPWMLAAGNGGFGGFGGFGGGAGLSAFLGGALGAIIPNFFGGWGNGGFGNNAVGGAGFISNQLSNESGRELLMNAITSQGEAARTATQSLATMLGQDFNLVNSDINALSTALSQLAMQEAVSVPQIINSIQSGNASLASQLCECCCNMKQLVSSQGYENQLRTVEQTNALGSAINANGQRTVDAIADLKTTMVKEFCDAKERDMQEKIDGLLAANSNLRSQIDNANQTAAITSYVNGVVAPLSAKVSEIASKQPNTVPVQYPNIVAMNNTPYVGGFAGYGYGYGVPGGSYWG